MQSRVIFAIRLKIASAVFTLYLRIPLYLRCKQSANYAFLRVERQCIRFFLFQETGMIAGNAHGFTLLGG